jgi:glycine/D-amino acid oxidase-like deaminating enzyme
MAAEGTQQVDVAVVGGGLAGLGVGLFLARAGVVVRVLEAAPVLGATGSARDLGLVRLGLLDHPNRLAEALGTERAVDLLRLGLSNHREWRELGALVAHGGLSVATLPGEDADLFESLPLFEQAGATARLVDAVQVNERLGGVDLGLALEVDEQGAIDPLAARQLLAGLITQAGGTVTCGARVAAVDEVGDGLVVRWAGGQLRAELVVHAAGIGSAQVEPWLRDKLWPVRAPVLCLQGAAGRFDWPWVSQTGFVSGRSLPGGDVLLSGCRWARLEQGMGEADEGVVDAKMVAALRGFSAHFAGLAQAPVAAQWSHVTAYSCDGLPFVGPMPGRPRELLCVGFQGLDVSLALAAARAVADGIVLGRSLVWPGWLSPGRMV